MKKIIIYTWSFCPYCIKAVSILDQEGIDYEEIEIFNNKEMLVNLKSKTGYGTVPQIFVDELFIGGCDDLVVLRKDSDKFNAIFK